MTQVRRRIFFWVAVAALVVIGIVLQARADDPDPAITSSQLATLKSDQSTEFATEEEALLQEFTCAVAVIALQFSIAERECERAIALSPQDPIAYKYRGLAYLLEHRFERAEADLKEAVRLDPRDADSQGAYAQALSGQGRFSEAIAKFGVALNLAPGDVRFLAARCWARGGEGKDYRAALRDCNKAIRLKPENAVAYDSRAFVYLRQGKEAQAASDYSTALKLQPHRATALLGRGLAEFRLGQIAKASADLREARKVDPEVDDIYILAGVLQEGCRSAKGPCELPAWLRPQPFAARSYLSVSYHRLAP